MRKNEHLLGRKLLMVITLGDACHHVVPFLYLCGEIIGLLPRPAWYEYRCRLVREPIGTNSQLNRNKDFQLYKNIQ